jgi:heat shock protein HtpX
VYEQVAQNKRRSALLVMGFVALVVAVGWVFTWIFDGGVIGLVLSVLFAGGLALAGYWNSDKVALRMSRARPADEREYARLHNLVEGLCIASGLPKPRLYVIDDPAPNAFATGRNPNNAAVAVTTGLLEKMNRVELEAVLAHELSHIRNYDMLVMTMAVTMVGIIALLADFGVRMAFWGSVGGRRSGGRGGGGTAITVLVGLVFVVLAPLAARAMQAAVSRRRETLADVSAVEMTRYPPGLISALEKLKDDQSVVRSGNRATAHMWIEEPVERYADNGARGSRLGRAFDTHPPLDDRIALLREM